MSLWHAADDGRKLAPMDEEALLDAFRQGRLSPRALIWREGMETWSPLRRVFPGLAARRRDRGPWIALSAIALFSGFLAVLSVAVWVHYLGGLEVLTRHVGVEIYRVIAITLAASAVIATPLTWRALGGVSGQELRGLLRIFIVIVGAAGLLIAGLQLFLARQIIDTTRAAEQMRDYRMAFNDATGVLSVSGQIGPGYAKMLEAHLARAPVSSISITSTGGLIAEALASARLLEARPQIAVVANDVCLSACVIVVMGGEQRLADYDMVLGFHAAVPVGGAQTPFAAALLRAEDEESDKYLISRGVPEQHVREAARLGGESMHLVSSLDLAEDGTLTGVLDANGREIPVWEARGLLAAQRYGRPE